MDIDAEHFGDFLGDEGALQLFPDVSNTPLSGLEYFEPAETNHSVPSSESQHISAETSATAHQPQDNEYIQPSNVHDNVDEVVSSASHIAPRGTGPESDFRKSVEISIFGETIENMAARLASEVDSERYTGGSSNRRYIHLVELF